MIKIDMKEQKIRKRKLSIYIILAITVAAILFISIYFVILFKDQNPPLIEKGEFPFRVVYEMKGEEFVIEDTIICYYDGLDHSALFGKPRRWNHYLKSQDESKMEVFKGENVSSVLNSERIDEEAGVVLHYGYGAYYMGDPNSNSLIHGKPHFCYTEKYTSSPNSKHYESIELSEKDLEKYFGIKISVFEFSKPLKNKFK